VVDVVLAAPPAAAQYVNVTPHGSAAGACDRDRPIPPGMVMNQVKGRPVDLANSGNTMELDGNAKYVSGC
jgi:hypothetical protein